MCWTELSLGSDLIEMWVLFKQRMTEKCFKWM